LALESHFQKHSSFAIIGSRFVGTSLVPAINVLSGLSKIPVKRFFVLVVAGEFFYVSLF
jgi:membrane protein DedA with SNARE-associated domain